MLASSLRISVPATAAAVRVIRTVASAAAAEHLLAFDVLEDMNLAIDEASGALLADTAGEGNLECVVSPAANGLDFTISRTTAIAQWPPVDWPGSLGAVVLNSVAADVSLDVAAGKPSITFTVGR